MAERRFIVTVSGARDLSAIDAEELADVLNSQFFAEFETEEIAPRSWPEEEEEDA